RRARSYARAAERHASRKRAPAARSPSRARARTPACDDESSDGRRRATRALEHGSAQASSTTMARLPPSFDDSFLAQRIVDFRLVENTALNLGDALSLALHQRVDE